MPINFNAPENRHTYFGREAQQEWFDLMQKLVDPRDKEIADIGCGGGIYSLAWWKMGAKKVNCVDFSQQMLADAAENTQGLPNIVIKQGDALCTGLPDSSQDIVFERALIHHIRRENRISCFAEAHRLLRSGGVYLLQDRTLQDIRFPGSPEHIRGYIFDVYPHLMNFENQRRPDNIEVIDGLQSVGFKQVKAFSLLEKNTVYKNFSQLAVELQARKGRSILHELSDEEIAYLIKHIEKSLGNDTDIVEKDFWTVWMGIK
ncbi:class I SAM-dependent methyltransferase [Xenorhabdus griffiniae]|uniref:Methyltransferase domain-containing protein n=1 Tax=Xenorhabdus griffiniae TaxID=351672 RepID=A0ABY9XCS5_9GAMM|nr:class I SAM-dependent methyltransferase [Xenorhabdus griffiniae]MBD1226434.1 methyltransferase domain-containing protein [Xenorhabdus griffiniae]MBE8588021.1 methyltransferase domain-containing protein [Xenorhabdus griffiniae]WMV70660.1 methyltransferase domain-containing protein [Xenorhabdus griffiniae]WNH00337.1 methyltransferase domain-containing protein [Xenorhabdus griffiniae]